MTSINGSGELLLSDDMVEGLDWDALIANAEKEHRDSMGEGQGQGQGQCEKARMRA